MQESKTYRPHDYLTIPEAAEEFRVTERHLRHLRQFRKVRCYVIAQRVRFRWIDLHEYFERQAIPVGGKR